MIAIFEWLLVLAESIILAVISFFGVILILWTFTMAGITADENGQHLYCEKSDTGVKSCYMRGWSIVD